jgi:hypothetical protein
MHEITDENNPFGQARAEQPHEVRMLRSRAESLAAQAESLPESLAVTYRRRARELQLEAYLLDNVLLMRAG